MIYKHILFAVELDSEPTQFVEMKVKDLVSLFQAKLSLIHIVQEQTKIYPGYLFDQGICVNFAKSELATKGRAMDVALENQHVEVGDPKVLIPEALLKLNIDLLVVGHHERKGVYRLLGSTAYAVLSDAKCDVLTVPFFGYY